MGNKKWCVCPREGLVLARQVVHRLDGPLVRRAVRRVHGVLAALELLPARSAGDELIRIELWLLLAPLSAALGPGPGLLFGLGLRPRAWAARPKALLVLGDRRGTAGRLIGSARLRPLRGLLGAAAGDATTGAAAAAAGASAKPKAFTWPGPIAKK